MSMCVSCLFNRQEDSATWYTPTYCDTMWNRQVCTYFYLGLLPLEEPIDNTLPAHLTLGCRLQLIPAVTASQHFCLGVSAPCVSGSSPLSLPLWSPGQSLPGDVSGRLPEAVASPTPLFSVDLCSHWFLIFSGHWLQKCGRVGGRRCVDGWDGLWLDNDHK